MNSAIKTLATAVLTGLVTIGGIGPLTAEESGTAIKTMKPISGPGVERDGVRHLLNLHVGGKQAVTYFLNEQGRCKLTLMVADAFNGEDVPNLSTVRFETAIAPGESTKFDTAEGKSLEFTCEAGAQIMNVRLLEQLAAN